MKAKNSGALPPGGNAPAAQHATSFRPSDGTQLGVDALMLMKSQQTGPPTIGNGQPPVNLAGTASQQPEAPPPFPPRLRSQPAPDKVTEALLEQDSFTEKLELAVMLSSMMDLEFWRDVGEKHNTRMARTGKVYRNVNNCIIMQGSQVLSRQRGVIRGRRWEEDDADESGKKRQRRE